MFAPTYLDTLSSYSEVAPERDHSSSRGIIIGAAVGGSILLLFLLFAGFYAYRQKERAKRAIGNNPFGKIRIYVNFNSFWL